nr:MAG TPA: hypothetical protein [Caudoviricetes sp.]
MYRSNILTAVATAFVTHAVNYPFDDFIRSMTLSVGSNQLLLCKLKIRRRFYGITKSLQLDIREYR